MLSLNGREIIIRLLFSPMGLLVPQGYCLKKPLKPVYAYLRSQGNFCMDNIDDSFFIGYNFTSCVENVVQVDCTF